MCTGEVLCKPSSVPFLVLIATVMHTSADFALLGAE